MKKLYYMIKNLIKIARLVSTDDSGNFSRGVASYMGKEVPILDMKPYGLLHRPPANSLCLIFSQNAQESSAIALIDDPKRRTLKNLIEGEVALNNQTTGDYIYLKDGNAIDLVTKTFTATTEDTTATMTNGQIEFDIGGAVDTTATMTNGQIVLDVNGTKVTIVDGAVTIDAALTTMNGNLQVNGTIDATGDITSDTQVIQGGAPVALSTHTHLYSPGPSTPTQTAAPTAGT